MAKLETTLTIQIEHPSATGASQQTLDQWERTLDKRIQAFADAVKRDFGPAFLIKINR